MILPLFLTTDELQTFNKAWAGLTAEQRHQLGAALDQYDHASVSLLHWLLLVIVRQYEDIERLRKQQRVFVSRPLQDGSEARLPS